MKKFSNTTAALVTLSILSVGSAAGYWLLYSRLSDTNARAAAVMGEIRAEEERARDARLLGDLVEDTASERATIGRRFVGKEDIVPFIERIEATARKAGIKAEVASVDVKPVPESATKEAIALKVTSTGSWRDTMYFAALLADQPYVIDISTVSLSASGIPPLDPKQPSASRARQWVAQFDFTALKHK